MNELAPAGFFVMRTPLLPWDEIEAWSEGLAAPAAFRSGGDLSSAVQTDAAVVRARLKHLARRVEIRDALYVASPSLDARLDKWLSQDAVDVGIERAVVRYLMRMAGRSTPFGLFAGIAVGRLDKLTDLLVPSRARHHRHTRIDMGYVLRLAEQISRRDEVQSQLRYRSNDTIYAIDGHLRFCQERVEKDVSHNLVDLESTPHLHAAIARASTHDGATAAEIATAVARVPDEAGLGLVGLENATEYVSELVDARILTSTLSPAVTGSEAAVSLADQLRTLPAAAALATTLQAALDDLAQVDAHGIGASPERYERIAANLRSLAPEIDFSPKFQVDLYKSGLGLTLGEAVVEDVIRGIELFASVAQSEESKLDRFIQNFNDRYGDREVPLLEVLDEESGIGFGGALPGEHPSPLTTDIIFSDEQEQPPIWCRRDEVLLKKLVHALRIGSPTIELLHDDIRAMSNRVQRPVPDGVAAMVSVAAASDAALTKGDYLIHLQSVIGTSAGANLGRFCHGSAVVDTRVRETLRKEEANDVDVLHAEIAYLPKGRLGNVTSRPLLRDLEVSVVGRSGAPPSHQLPLTDLLISVRDGEVRLHSRTRGKRVKVHLTCAHNYARDGLGIYRFLCTLQEQGVRQNLFWSWGALRHSPYLPRVVHGRLVLSLASWKIPSARFDAIRHSGASSQYRAMQALRDELSLPRHVRFGDSDVVLPVDLDNVLSVESFLAVATKTPVVDLSESFPPNAHLVARGPEGRFHHEMIVPFVRRPVAGSEASFQRPLSPSGESHTNFSTRPGSDWLYFKVYAGPATVDTILVEVLAPLVKTFMREGTVDRWFFVRYGDPEWHLRIRLHGDRNDLWQRVAPELLRSLDASRATISRVLIDTYDPEIERYGGPIARAPTEHMFLADSTAALEIVRRFRADLDARWRLTLLGMDAFLESFDLSLSEKREVATRALASYGRRDRDGSLARQVGEKFRKRRLDVEAVLDWQPTELTSGFDAVRARTRDISHAARLLKNLSSDGALSKPLAEIAASHLHMWANRVLRGSARAHETLLYAFLQRAYEGRGARSQAAS